MLLAIRSRMQVELLFLLLLLLLIHVLYLILNVLLLVDIILEPSILLYEKLNNNTDLDYIRDQVSINVVKNITNHFDSIKYLDDFKYDMTRVFLNSTNVAMYRYWALSGKKVPIEEAIKITTKLVKDGIKSITK